MRFPPELVATKDLVEWSILAFPGVVGVGALLPITAEERRNHEHPKDQSDRLLVRTALNGIIWQPEFVYIKTKGIISHKASNPIFIFIYQYVPIHTYIFIVYIYNNT